jgi:hypothetical protein
MQFTKNQKTIKQKIMNYIAIFQMGEKGKKEKIKVYAPCNQEAWLEAETKIPIGCRIIDVVPMSSSYINEKALTHF